MEWVETTGKTIEEARERALDQLGVADDDAEIEVLEEPRAGLFGLIRGEARVRARVRPAEVRPKQDRRRGRKSDKSRGDEESGTDHAGAVVATAARPDRADDDAPSGDRESDDGASDGKVSDGRASDDEPAERVARPPRARRGRDDRADGDARSGDGRSRGARGGDREARDEDRPPVDPAEVGAAAVTFMEGLVEAFGLEATVELVADDIDLEVQVHGNELGLLIGPGGRTLAAIQDLARVAAQRRLGDHDTRLRIDVAGYRVRRREALERFARSVAQQVLESGTSRSMEPMPSADRKVIHDVLTDIDGVSSRSEGDDPDRRVVVVPA